MKIYTIPAEFNPLHCGHEKLIAFAKKQADAVFCVMSGNFTQRGLPAAADKYARARHAVEAGVDAVFQLPTVFSISSAENFAYGAVAAAKALRSTALCFGSESGDAKKLAECAEKMAESQNDNGKIKELLRGGASYPAAVANAYPEYGEILSRPNNVLALEYVKAAKKLGGEMQYVTLKRDTDYNGEEESDCSSKAIRKLLAEGRNISKLVPKYVADDLTDLHAESRFKEYAALLLPSITAEELKNIDGVSEGLENRFYKYGTAGHYDEIIARVKTKRYTQLKLQRILANLSLGITKDVVTEAKKTEFFPTLLAFNAENKAALRYIGKAREEFEKVYDSAELSEVFAKVETKADRIYEAISR